MSVSESHASTSGRRGKCSMSTPCPYALLDSAQPVSTGPTFQRRLRPGSRGACPSWFPRPLSAPTCSSHQPSCGLPSMPASLRAPSFLSSWWHSPLRPLPPADGPVCPSSSHPHCSLTTPLPKPGPSTHCSPAWPPSPDSKVPFQTDPSSPAPPLLVLISTP